MTVGAILLAAGSARRMGENKLLADLGGRPMVLHAFEAIVAAGLGPPIVAITPGSAVAGLFDGRATLVTVADHASGMGHSLSGAIGHAPPQWTAAIICLGDMPFVRPETLAALAGKADDQAIVRPRFEGRPGNPLLWGRAHFDELAQLSGDEGGRALFDRHAVEWLDCYDRGVLFDVDTPDALAAARRILERP